MRHELGRCLAHMQNRPMLINTGCPSIWRYTCFCITVQYIVSGRDLTALSRMGEGDHLPENQPHTDAVGVAEPFAITEKEALGDSSWWQFLLTISVLHPWSAVTTEYGIPSDVQQCWQSPLKSTIMNKMRCTMFDWQHSTLILLRFYSVTFIITSIRVFIKTNRSISLLSLPTCRSFKRDHHRIYCFFAKTIK